MSLVKEPIGALHGAPRMERPSIGSPSPGAWCNLAVGGPSCLRLLAAAADGRSQRRRNCRIISAIDTYGGWARGTLRPASYPAARQAPSAPRREARRTGSGPSRCRDRHVWRLGARNTPARLIPCRQAGAERPRREVRTRRFRHEPALCAHRLYGTVHRMYTGSERMLLEGAEPIETNRAGNGARRVLFNAP